MESPVFWSQVLTKVTAQYATFLSIAIANDMIMISKNAKEVGYDKLQTEFELTRGVTRNVFNVFLVGHWLTLYT